MSLNTLKPRNTRATPRSTRHFDQGQIRADSIISSSSSLLSLEDNQDASLTDINDTTVFTQSASPIKFKSVEDQSNLTFTDPTGIPDPCVLIENLENAMYSNMEVNQHSPNSLPLYEHHDETSVDAHFGCISANLTGTQFSINGVLPASFLYSTAESLSSSGDGTSSVTIRRRQVKSATLTITFDDLTTREIEIRNQPDLLCTVERSLQDPVTGKIYPLAKCVSQIECNPSLASAAFNLHVVNVPIAYESPVITIAPVSNLTGYSHLSSVANAPMTSRIIKDHTRAILNSIERSSFFNLHRFIRTETLARSTLHANYVLSNDTKASHRQFTIYGSQVNGKHITDVINCCDCPKKLNAINDSVEFSGVADYTPSIPSILPNQSNQEYHYPYSLGVSTLLPMVFDRRIASGLDVLTYPPTLGLRTKLNTDYIYAEYAGTQKMNQLPTPESYISFHFYSATDDANSDTSFPSQRPLYTDASYVGTCLLVSRTNFNTFNITMYYAQDNIIIECFTTSSQIRTYHFRLNGFKFTTISNLFVEYQADLLADLCQSFLDNIFSPNHTPADLDRWFVPACDMSNLDTHLFNTIPLATFSTTPQSSYFGSNILDLLSASTLDKSLHESASQYLRECCAHAGAMLSNQFIRFPSLPVTSRNKYTDHYYDTPVMWSDPKYSAHSSTFSAIGVIPVGGLSTHIYKALFSKARTQLKNGSGTKYGLGYNSFDYPYYIDEKRTDGKVYVCELCHQLYPTCFGSLFCKAKHIASQTLLISDKDSGNVRASYVHYLLPHVANPNLISVLVGQDELKTIYTPNRSRVYRLYSNRKDADSSRNALTFFVSRHSYDPLSGKYISSDPYDTKIDVRPFLPLRPNGHSDHSIRVFVTKDNSDSKPRRARPQTKFNGSRGRSSSRVVDNSHSDRRQRYRDTSSVRKAPQTIQYTIELPSKPSVSGKSKNVRSNPPTKSLLDNYLSNFVPDHDLTNYKDNTRLYNSSNKVISSLNKFRYDRVKNIARTLNPVCHDYKTAYTFYSSVRPDFFKTLGEFDLDCFASYDNAKCTNYCSDWQEDMHSLGNFFDFGLTSYLSKCGGLRTKRIYAFPPPDDTVINSFMDLIANTPQEFETTLLIPSKYAGLVKLDRENLLITNSVLLNASDYQGFPLFISGNTSSHSYDNTTLEYTLFTISKIYVESI